MKIVAVSQRVDAYSDRNEWRDALDQKLNLLLVTAGYVPVPVPNGMYQESLNGVQNRDAFVSWVEGVNFQAVLLSGGNDIGTCMERDVTEGYLLDYAEQCQLPVLGICRGMQMMGVRTGAKLKTVVGHIRTRHVLTGEISRDVNSYHNQSLADCPTGFSVLARSEDGEIEAIRNHELPWEGWMWHPERENKFHSGDVQRLQALFE